MKLRHSSVVGGSTVNLRLLVLKMTAMLRLKCLLERASHRTIERWALISRVTMSYVLALTRWLFNETCILFQASMSVAHALRMSNARLVLIQDASFVIHSRQYCYTTRALDIVNSCAPDESLNIAEKLLSVTRIEVCDKDRRRSARAALMKVTTNVPIDTIAILDDATVSIFSADFFLVTTLTIEIQVSSHRTHWVVNSAFHEIDDKFHVPHGSCAFDQVPPLRKLLGLVVQAGRSHVLSHFYEVARNIERPSRGEISTGHLGNTVFLRVWPHGGLERTWRVEAVINSSSRCISALHATITSRSHFESSSSPSSIDHYPSHKICYNCSAVYNDLISPFGIIDIATTLSTSHALFPIMIQHHYCNGKNVWLLINRHVHFQGDMIPAGVALFLGYSPIHSALCTADSLESHPALHARHIFLLEIG